MIATYPRFKFEQTWMHHGVEFLKFSVVSAKLHYTDTGYEHRLRTPPTDELTTILQQLLMLLF